MESLSAITGIRNNAAWLQALVEQKSAILCKQYDHAQ
jgi:hypothetical protein